MQLWQKLTSRFRPQPAADSSRAQIAALIARARQASSAEDYDHAWSLLLEAEAAAAQASDLVRFDIALQKVYVRLGQQAYDEAQTLLQQVTTLAEAHPRKAPLAYAQIARGQLAEARGDFAIAEAAYEEARATARAARASAAQGRATALLGALALREDNATFAAHLLREAIPLMEAAQDEELLAFAYGQLGLAVITSHDTARGLGLLNKAIEVGMKHNQVVTLRALNRAATEHLAAAEQYDKAYASALNLLKLYPYPERTPMEYLEAHIRAAYLAYKSRSVESGLALIVQAHTLQAALTDRGWFITIQAVEGLLLTQTNRTERAVELLEETLSSGGIRLNEVEQAAYQALSEAYLNELRYDEAIELLKRARRAADASKAPLDDYDAQARIVNFRRYMPNQRHVALVDYEELMRLAEQRGGDQSAIPLANMSVIESELGMGPRALRHIERALLVSSKNPLVNDPVLRAGALVYYDYGDLETAEGLARKALAYTSKHTASAVNLTLARILLARGQPEAALSALQAALTDPNYGIKVGAMTRLLALKSQACGALGSPTLALEHAHEALKALYQPQHQPEEAAAAYQALGLAQLAAGEATAGQQSLRDALAHAKRSDCQLQIWEITLQLADALLPYEADEADALLAEVRERIAHAEPRRLLALLYTVESKLAAHRGDMAAARQRWQAATHHRQLAQLPTAAAPWLEETHE